MFNRIKNKIQKDNKTRFAFSCACSFILSLAISLCFVRGRADGVAIGVCIGMTLIFSLLFSLVCYAAIFSDGTKAGPLDKLWRFFTGLSYDKKCKLLLHAAVLFTCCFVFLRLDFCGKLFSYHDIGADTTDQYIPWYVHVINSIRDGSFSLWENELGLGNSVAIRLSNMNDPFIIFSILLGVIFGSKHIVLYLVISRILIFVLTAECCYRFLSLFCKNPLACAVSSYIFAYNSFGVIWGQHYMFAPYPLYAVLLLYFIERALRREKSGCELGLVLISFAALINGAYMVYMMYLPAAVYTVLRYVYLNDKFSIKHIIAKGSSIVASILLGLMGGMLTGISTIKAILSSGRVGAETGGGIQDLLSRFFEWFDFDELIFRLQRMISGNLNGVGSVFEGTEYGFDYYNAAQIYFSVFFIIFALQFIATLRKTSSNRKTLILNIVSVVLVLCALFNQGFTYVMYAFSGMSSRPVFTLLPYFAILTAVVFDNIFNKKIINKLALLIGLILTQILLFKSYFGLNESTLTQSVIDIIVVDCVLVIAVGYLILLFAEKPQNRMVQKTAILTACIGLLFSVTLEFDVSTNRSGNFDKAVYEEKYALADDVSAALEYIESIDPDYYRIEETFLTFKPVADSLMLGFNSVTMYDSALSAGLKEFNNYYLDQSNSSYPSWLFPVYTDSIHDLTVYSTLSLKYLLSRNEGPYLVPQDNDNYEYLTTVENIRIYRNKNVNSFTTFYTQAVKKSEFLALTKPERLRVLSTCVIINDEDADKFAGYLISAKDALALYSEEDITESALVSGTAPLSSDSSGYIVIELEEGWSDGCLNTFMDFTGVSHGGGYDVFFDTGSGFDWKNQYFVRSNAEEVTEHRVYIPKNTKSILFNFNGSIGEVLDLGIYNAKEEIRPSANPSVMELHEKDSHLCASVTCDSDGVLFIPITYSEQWHVEIDGEECEVMPGDSGFMAVNVNKGSHNISIKYVSSSLKVGVVLFTASLLLTLAWYFEPKIREKIKSKITAKKDN